MNNTVENDFFWISQGKVAIQVSWANVPAIDVEFSQDLTRQNH